MAKTMMFAEDIKAFDLSKESPAMRKRYGKSAFANACLLARRLVEQGVRYVHVDYNGWGYA